MTPERERPVAPKPTETEAQRGTDLPWARVAAELRAYREEQRRAWGDVDSTTLGRYLAGEVSADERQEVEQALDELPELRKLTDLVRDVLEDYEPTATPAPVVLPFSAPPPFQYPKRSRRLQYASLALAASVLLTLGVALPRSNMLAQVFDLPASAPTFASRAPMGWPADMDRLGTTSSGLDGAVERDALPTTPRLMKVQGKPPRFRDEQEWKEVSHLPGLPPLAAPAPVAASNDGGMSFVGTQKGADGKDKAKAGLRTVAVLSRQAEACWRYGDPRQAANTYCRAYRLGLEAAGPAHPETLRARNNLAQVYEAALNSPVEQTYEEGDAPTAVTAKIAPEPPMGDRRVPPQTRMALRPLQEELLEASPGQLKADVVPVLVESLREAKTSEERQHLALALGRLGPSARPAVPVLVDTLRKRATQAEERSVLLTTLGQIGPGARQALPVLVSSVCDETAPEARRSAAYALVEMGPAARGAVSELIKPGVANDPLVRDVVRHIRGRAGRIGICDECDCFSAAALTQARDTIRSLAQNANVEVLVETVSALPPAANEPAAKDLGSRGIHVVIGKDDRAVRVKVATSLQQQGITLVSLARSFAGPLRQKDFDASLRAGVHFIARVEKSRTPARR